MKKIIILFACCLGVVSLGAAEPWGIWKRAIFRHTFAIDKLLANQPITYAFEGEFSPEEKELVRLAFLAWVGKPLQYIQESNREEEFQDIIPILQRGFTLIQEVPAGNSDFTVEWAELESHIGASVMPQNDSMLVNVIIKDNMDFFYRIITHEAGHMFGLGDQYWEGMEQNSPIYQSDPNTTQGSIMRSLDELQQFSCDDADGLINLLDLRIYQRDGSFPKRARTGWKSLCPNTTQVYKKSQPTQSASRAIRERDRWEDFTDKRVYYVRYFQRKDIKNQPFSVHLPDLLALFDLEESDRVERNKEGRITAVYGKEFVRRFSYVTGEEGQPGCSGLEIALQTPDGITLEKFSFLVEPDSRNITYLNPNKAVDGMVVRAPGKGVRVEGEKKAIYHLRRAFEQTASPQGENGDFIVSGEVKVDTLEQCDVIYKFSLTKRSNFYDFFVSVSDADTREQKPTTHFVISQDRDSWLPIGVSTAPLPVEQKVFDKALRFLEDNQKWLDSYYRNFYPFLFDQLSTEEIQAQLKQALKSGVRGNMVK